MALSSFAALSWSLGWGMLAYSWLRGFLPPARHPRFVRERKPHLFVATGASATHGRVSYDWVSELDRRLADDGWTCLNLGFNGRRAVNVARSLGDVTSLHPEVVVVMVGVNDVNGFTPLDRYRSELEAIVDRLRTDTSARIGICTLTAIGDDPACPAMQRAAAFNQAVRDICASKHVACIDVAAAQIAWLQNHGSPPGRSMLAFLPLMTSSLLQRYILLSDWDRISRVHGLHLTTDLVHQNSVGGTIIADLVEKFIREPSPQSAGAPG